MAEEATPLQPLWRRMLLGLASLVMAAALWLPCLHLFFPVDTATVHGREGLSAQAESLLQRQLALWTDPELLEHSVDRMRNSNAEWDFMGRTYLVWALANVCLRDPGRQAEALPVIDRIIDETLRLEAEHGITFFLMDYATPDQFVRQPARSLFVDGEIAMMLGMRRLVEEREEYRPLLAERVLLMEQAMRASEVLCAESYPDECWMFDNANALAAMRMADVLDGTDHSGFFDAWLEHARRRLVHGETGLLVSKFDLRGGVGDGPEGSTCWQVAHALQVVFPEFALDQYERAREELQVRVLGFGLAREWPDSWRGPQDIDSGMIVPLVDASPSSSGLALVAASTFRDEEFLSELLRSLDFAAFPIEDETGLRYVASSQLGDAVLLYALTCGPLWQRVQAGGGR